MMSPSDQIIAELLAAHTGQELAPDRLWRISSTLTAVFRDHGISNVDQLVCLLAEGNDKALATQVVEALLNNETYFFRDNRVFAHLASDILPELAAKRTRSKRLSIWSAGCSTGQEAYSLAMLFAQQPDKWDGWDISILGTDVSRSAIESARKGCYSPFEIQRGISVMQMLSFFDEGKNAWSAQEDLTHLTRFEQHNLLDPAPEPGRFDLILCRNVMLYFNAKNRERIFTRLSGAMAPDGWLVLGSGETAGDQTNRLVDSPEGTALCQLARTSAAPLQRQSATA